MKYIKLTIILILMIISVIVTIILIDKNTTLNLLCTDDSALEYKIYYRPFKKELLVNYSNANEIFDRWNITQDDKDFIIDTEYTVDYSNCSEATLIVSEKECKAKLKEKVVSRIIIDKYSLDFYENITSINIETGEEISNFSHSATCEKLKKKM